MPIVADASVAIRGDMSGFNADLQKSETAVGGFATRVSDSIKKTFSAKNLLGAFGLAYGANQIVQFAGDAAASYAELEQTVRTIDSVFGDSADVIHEWGETAAETAGMSQQTFMSSASVMGQTLLNMGFAQDEAAQKSTELLQRAADLAIAYGKRPQDALIAITAAMRGERDTIEKFGVAIKQVDVNARIAALGLDTSTAAAKKNSEAIAVLQLVLDQSATSAGRFANSQNDIAVKMAKANAQWENFVAQDVGAAVASIQLGFFKLVDEGAELWDATTDDLNNFAMNFGHQRTVILENAEALGMGFGEMKDEVTRYMREMGVDFDTAVAMIAGKAEFASEQFLAQGQRYAESLEQGITGGLANSDTVARVDAAFHFGISDPVFAAMLEAEENSELSGHQVVIKYAQGLLQPQTDVEVAIEAALQVVEDEMTATEEYAYLSGQKTVLEEARGLAEQEGKQAAVTAINGALGMIQARMDALEDSAFISGGNLIAAYVGGMYLGMPAISDAAYELANRLSPTVEINSEPKDHNSPLYGITKWGGNLVRTYAEGIYGELGTAASAANALAGSLVPTLGGAGGMAGGMAPMGQTINNYLQVEGVPKQVRNADEMWAGFEQMSDRSMTR